MHPTTTSGGPTPDVDAKRPHMGLDGRTGLAPDTARVDWPNPSSSKAIMTHLVLTAPKALKKWAKPSLWVWLLALTMIQLTATGPRAQTAPPARLVQVIQADPDNRPARWQLARLLFQAGQYRSARYHVRRLLDTATTAADVDILTRALTDISTAAPLQYQLNFGLLPSTNLHRYTYNSVFRTQIGDFQPIGGGRAKAGVGLSLGGQLTYAIPQTSHAQLSFGLRAAARLYETRDLNTAQVSALVRYDWFGVGQSTRVEPFVSLRLDQNLRAEQRRVGLHWARVWRIDPGQRVTLRLTGEHRTELGSDGNQGVFGRAQLNYRTQITNRVILSASAAAARYHARADHLAYVDGEISLEMTRQFDRIGRIGVFGTAARRDFDGLFPATTRARRDGTLRLGLSFVPPRSMRLGDWQPQISCAGVETWSNIDLYDIRSVDCGLTFARSF